jgi:hypothetical protein
MGALQCMMTKGRPPKFESIPKVTYAVGKLLNGEEVELTAVFHYVERRAWDVIYTFGQSGISQYTFTLSAMIIVLHKQMYFMFSFSQDKTPDIRDMSVTSRQCLFPDERTLKFFPVYSEPNCAVECAWERAKNSCVCVPWFLERYYPDSNICELSGNSCFRS